MLDEAEFVVVEKLYISAMRAIKAYQEAHCGRNTPEEGRQFMIQQYGPVLEAYKRFTGWEEPMNPAELMHHRISKYGPPCSICSKPLRTPKAKLCVACGAVRATQA
jgi:hypothetical protein